MAENLTLMAKSGFMASLSSKGISTVPEHVPKHVHKREHSVDKDIDMYLNLTLIVTELRFRSN
jgi:hypothetical protein